MNLGRASLQDWDEATYAEIAREIRVFHDWLHLHWNYVPWFNKPPLYIWLTAGLFHFGASAFWARAISALAAVGVVLITYAIGKRFYGRLAGVTAAVVTCSCYQFLAAARFGTSDMLLTLFLYASLYAYLEARDRPRWWYGVGIFTGLAIMTKGPAALVAPAAIVATLLIDRRLHATVRMRHLWGGLAVALAIALPWHVLSYLYYGPAFFDQYLGNMVFARVGQSIEGHDGDLFTYFGFLRNQFFPWAYLVPFALLAFARHRLHARDGSWVLVVFPAIVLALYTVVQTKLVWYILPVYPALAILIAALLVRAVRGELVALLAVGLGLVAALVSVPSSLDLQPPLLTLAFFGVLALVVTRWRTLKGALAPALVGAVGVFFLATVGLRSAGLYTSGDLPVVSIGKSAKAAVMGRPVGLVLFIADAAQATDFDVSHSLLFYSHRPVHVAIGTAELKQAVGCKPHDVVLAVGDLPSVPHDYQLSTVREKAPLIHVAAHPIC